MKVLARNNSLRAVLNVLLVDWHVSVWSECGLDESALLSLVTRCVGVSGA